MGTSHQIEVDLLTEMLAGSPSDMISSGTTRTMFLLFVLNYARHAAPKDRLKKELMTEVVNAGDTEGEHKHMCHVDLLSTSDIAYAMWQYVNSYDDWVRKLKDGQRRFKHDTKWSSDRTGAKMVEGLKYYQDMVRWCRSLKKLWYDEDASDEHKGEYEEMRVACNIKAKEMGFILSKSAMTLKKDQDYEEEEVELATFDFGEMNEVRGDCY